MYKNRIPINMPSAGPSAPQGKAYRMGTASSTAGIDLKSNLENIVFKNLEHIIKPIINIIVRFTTSAHNFA
jgi:hypothetical protein